MKILHLASEYPPAKVYGLGRFVHGLARAQAAMGDEVAVLTNSTGGDQDGVVLEGVHLHRIEFPNPPRPASGHGEVLQWNHGVVARLLDRLPEFRDVDVVQAHDWLSTLAAREVAGLLDRPLVFTFHDEVVGKRFGVLEPDDQATFDLEALAAQQSDHVIANSRFMAREVARIYGVEPERITAIPGGIDPKLLDVLHPEEVSNLRPALGRPGEALILYVGRLDPEKGLETLCEAWHRPADQEPQARLLVAGSGAHEERLQSRLGDRARILGYVEPEALRYLYRAADAVVVPSVYEPFGLVALEAMLAGTALVTSDAGGLAEIVQDGCDGLQVPAGDARALSSALLRLVRSPALRSGLGSAARERVLRDFSWDSIARRTREVYQRVLGRPTRLHVSSPTSLLPPQATVVIETMEAPIHLRSLLRSLARSRRQALEILVVDKSESEPARSAVAELLTEARSWELDVQSSSSLEAALEQPRGRYVLRLQDELEVPSGSEDWLAGLFWILESTGARSASPTLLSRTAFTREPQGLERRLRREPRPTEPTAACMAVRQEDRALLFDRSPRKHWRHPLPLVVASGESRRDMTASYQATATTGFPASIVLVAYQNRHLTEDALRAVLAHTAPPFELVLVDNGSSDGTRELFRGLAAELGGSVGVQVIENATNLGYPVAANQGCRAARGQHVVLLNNDTVVRPNWLGALLEAAAGQERVGLVTAKVLNLDGTVQSAGGIEHCLAGDFSIPGQGEDRLAPTVGERRQVRNAGGPCLLLTRPLLEAVAPDGRPFDEAYTPGYFEDSDLCFRAREAGFSLLFEPRAEVFHHGKATADLVARQGKSDVWGAFRRNEERFRDRWRARLEADEAERAAEARTGLARPQRRRIVLCYDRSTTTTAAYCEKILAREHEVITAGRGQDLDLGRVSARAICEAAGGDIDLLLMIEGETYLPEELPDAPCPTAAWLIANHLHAQNERGWHYELGREVDHVFVAQKDYLARFERLGARSSSWLPLACDPEIHAQPTPREGRDLDIVFVGHLRAFHQRRRALLERLQRRFRVHVEEGVWLADMARLYARAKVVFNCSLSGDLNMRTFEALASGALLVSDRAGNGLEDLFADREHLLLYGDEDLEEVVAHALADEAARTDVAARGQRLALRYHTYGRRMRTLISVLERLTPARLAVSA